MIDELIDHLENDSAISALVSTRIHPGWIPQGGIMPALTVQRVGGISQLYVDGSKRLHEGRYQVDCWARTKAEVEALMSAVLTVLNGFVGDMGGVRVALSLCDSRLDSDDLEGDRSTRRISLDFDITHEE